MAIGFRAVGTMSTSTSDPATAPGMPAGFAAGDMHLLVVGSKAATPPTLVTPSGYTAPSNNTITGGAGTAGATSGGPVRVTGLWRQAVGGDTGPAIDLSAAGSPTMAALIGFTKGASEAWVAPVCAVAADTTGSTTSYDPAAAATVLGCVAGDWIVAVHVLNDEAGTMTVPGTLTVTGLTLSAVTNRLNQSTTTGNDGRLFIDTVSVSSGTDSAGPNAAIALTGGIANFAGASVFFRLRVTAGSVLALAGGATSTSSAAANLTRRTPISGGASSTTTAAAALGIVVIHAVAGGATSSSTASAALTISKTAYFPDSASGTPPDNDPAVEGIWGGDFSANTDGQITHVLVWHPATSGPASYTAAVHLQSSQAQLTTQASGTLSAGAWNAIALSSPVPTTATVKYTVSVTMSGSAKAEFDLGSTDHTSGGITAYGSLGRFKNVGYSAGQYPSSSEAGTGFGIGIRFVASEAGGTTHDAAGGATSTSSAAANLTRITPVAGAASSTVTSAAALRAILTSAGAATSTFIAAGALTARQAAAGAALSTSTAAGALAYVSPMAGSATSTVTVTATLQVSHGVAGAATSTSAAAASVTASLALTGSAVSTSTASGALTRITPVAGGTTSTFTASAAVTSLMAPTGSALSLSTAAANLTRITPVAGAASSTSTTSADLTITSGPVIHALAAAATSTTAAAASLTATLSLASSATSTITASAALTRVTPLAGTASSASTTTASLTIVTGPVAWPLAGGTSSTSSATAAFTASLALTGTASSTSTTTASVTLRGAVTADAVTTATASAELGLIATLSGSATTLSSAAAAIGFLHLLAAAAVSVSTTSADLEIDLFSPIVYRPGSGGTVRPGYGMIPRPYSDVIPRT